MPKKGQLFLPKPKQDSQMVPRKLKQSAKKIQGTIASAKTNFKQNLDSCGAEMTRKSQKNKAQGHSRVARKQQYLTEQPGIQAAMSNNHQRTNPEQTIPPEQDKRFQKKNSPKIEAQEQPRVPANNKILPRNTREHQQERSRNTKEQ